jgi:hypothetical protein
MADIFDPNTISKKNESVVSACPPCILSYLANQIARSTDSQYALSTVTNALHAMVRVQINHAN